MFSPSQNDTIKCVLAGAALLDLSLAGRIDTDLESLIVLDDQPTGSALMDAVLARIAQHPQTTDTQHWIEVLSSAQTLSIPELALRSLEQDGIVARQDQKFLWFSRTRTYPIIDFDAKENVKKRIREVVLSDDVPDPAVAAAACLVEACGLFAEIFNAKEIRARQSRLKNLRQLDLIGREVIRRIAAIERKQILAVRRQTARLRKLVLILSTASALGAAATLLSPRAPIPDRFGPTLWEQLWNNSIWQQWSGYLLLAVSLVGLLIVIGLKNRLLIRIGNYSNWQLTHVGLGLICVFVLFAHTGFRLGDNLNAILMVFFLTSLLLGALTGILIGGTTQLRKFGVKMTRNMRIVPIRTHVIALLPLPALLIVHILIVYLY